MFNRTSDSGLAATMLCASLILGACGGGGGGGSGSSGSSASSGGDATKLESGLYVADVKYTNGADPQSAVTYLSPTGKFTVVFLGGAGLSFGRLEFDNASISGSSIDYRQLDPNQRDPKGFVEDRSVQEGTISGTVNSQVSARFSTADAAGAIHTEVRLQRQNTISDIGISLKRVSGIYEKGESEVALTVREDGSLDAQYYAGCQLGGIESLSVLDASINVFDITYTMSLCDNDIRNGAYSGLGFLGPTEDGSMRMVFAAHNGDVAMQFEGIR